MPKEANGIIVGSHASCAIIHRVLPDGTVEFANLTKRGRPGRLHVMETQEGREGPLETLNSGLLSEAAADAEGFYWWPVSLDPVFFAIGKDTNPKHAGKMHLKLFYLVSVASKLRDFDKRDGDDILTKMEWWEAERLIEHMRRVGTVPSHLTATERAMLYLRDTNFKVYERYSKLIASITEVEVSEEIKASVQAYLARKV